MKEKITDPVQLVMDQWVVFCSAIVLTEIRGRNMICEHKEQNIQTIQTDIFAAAQLMLEDIVSVNQILLNKESDVTDGQRNIYQHLKKDGH